MKNKPVREVKRDHDGLTRCRVCGCTETDACFPPCAWVPGEPDLCDNCGDTVQVLLGWESGARRGNVTALLREFRERMAAKLRRAAS
jgi:hypothetical protein